MIIITCRPTSRGGFGTSLMGRQWEGHKFQLGGKYAAELRILLVYLSESLWEAGPKWGRHWGHIFHWVAAPWTPVEPPLIRVYAV